MAPVCEDTASLRKADHRRTLPVYSASRYSGGAAGMGGAFFQRPRLLSGRLRGDNGADDNQYDDRLYAVLSGTVRGRETADRHDDHDYRTCFHRDDRRRSECGRLASDGYGDAEHDVYRRFVPAAASVICIVCQTLQSETRIIKQNKERQIRIYAAV